ncbi:MAG: acylphosphatase [Deltaproteobacteria bacterium]|nr:acylphosphatase [Deltaproteobacteria bacterium]
MKYAFYAIIHGLVQGVAFRHHTRETARNLSLNGYARNLKDGTVEVLAEGEEDALKSLASWLEHGPSHARVEQVDLDWRDATAETEPFTIKY